MKNLTKLLSLLMTMVLMTGCFFSYGGNKNTTEETIVEKGNLTVSINTLDCTDSTSTKENLFTTVMTKAVVTVTGSDFSESYSTVVDMANGINDEEIYLEDIPAGKNRIISVQTYHKNTNIPGLCLRGITDIEADEENSANVSWATTALGNVYYRLLNSGTKIASFTESQNSSIASVVDSDPSKALLVNSSAISKNFINGSLKSKSDYAITPGTVSFTCYYPINSFTAYLNEPGSKTLTGCVPGKTYTFENCSKGYWTIFIVDEETSTVIGTQSLVNVESGTENDAGVINYDGIMIVSDAVTNTAYKNLYTFNYNGAGDTAYGAAYPGSQMTQYGDFYIQAYPSCSTLSVIANKGSETSDRLYSEDVVLTKQGVYLLTSDAPGYIMLTEDSGISGDDYESPATIDFENLLYINLSEGTWSTTENGIYSEISTKKTTIGTESNYIKVQYTKDDDSNSTGLIEINAKNSSGDTAFYLTGTQTTGGVKIQSNGNDTVMVYLNNVAMTSSDYPCIEVTKGSKTYVTLNGTNTLTDGRIYGTGYGEEFSTSSSDTYEDDDGNIVSCTVSKSVVKEGSASKATLFSKGNLILTGTGTLKITESYKNCIGSKGFITVDSGTYNLTSNAKNGFDARYGFTQNGGNITFTGNGAITASSSISTSAYVKKTNGIVVDGIISATNNGWIKINGGSYTCNATYGKGMNAKWDSSECTENDGTSTTGKPDPSVYISGGNISINVTGTGWTNDDSNGKTSKYYYDADGVKCYEIVKCAAEGIESLNKINISGGTIEITADNDCINASLTGGSVTISGGSLYCATGSADAVDSNGNIYVTGGTIVVCAPMGSEDGLDGGDGYSVTISGGLVASCSGTSNASANASGVVVINGKSLSATSGNTIVIKDSSSNLLYAFTIPTVSSSSSSSGGMGGMGGMGGSSSSGYGSIIFASPNFTSTGTYTIYKGATVTGGTNFHGLYTSLPTVSSTGSSAGTVSVTSKSGSYSCGSSSSFGGRP